VYRRYLPQILAEIYTQITPTVAQKEPPEGSHGHYEQSEGKQARQTLYVADKNEPVLFGGVSGRTSLRRQSVRIAVPTVRLGTAAARRSRVHRVPDSEPHPVLPVAAGQRQPEDSARGKDEISDRHRLQREPNHVRGGGVSR